MLKILHSNKSIKYEYYNKVFKENFDLKFGRPQVDTCCVCEQLTIKLKNKDLNDAAKRVAAAELIVHKRRAKKFRATHQSNSSKYLLSLPILKTMYPLIPKRCRI